MRDVLCDPVEIFAFQFQVAGPRCRISIYRNDNEELRCIPAVVKEQLRATAVVRRGQAQVSASGETIVDVPCARDVVLPVEGHVAVHRGAHVRKRMAIGILQMIGLQAVAVRAGWVGRDIESASATGRTSAQGAAIVREASSSAGTGTESSGKTSVIRSDPRMAHILVLGYVPREERCQRPSIMPVILEL
jgi:hypothetical protein